MENPLKVSAGVGFRPPPGKYRMHLTGIRHTTMPNKFKEKETDPDEKEYLMWDFRTTRPIGPQGEKGELSKRTSVSLHYKKSNLIAFLKQLIEETITPDMCADKELIWKLCQAQIGKTFQLKVSQKPGSEYVDIDSIMPVDTADEELRPTTIKEVPIKIEPLDDDNIPF